jgi:hypothetical protein
MKCIIAIAGLLICLSSPLFAQEWAEEPTVKLPDAVMKRVVKEIVLHYFGVSTKQKTIYIAETINKEWLPKIRKIRFVVLEGRGKSFGQKAYFFDGPYARDNKTFEIDVGYGTSYICSQGDKWRFSSRSTRVKADVFAFWQNLCYIRRPKLPSTKP